MSLAGIQRLVAIVSDVQSRTHSRAELEAHHAFLTRAHAVRRDLFHAAPTAGVMTGSKSNPGDAGAAPIHAGKG